MIYGVSFDTAAENKAFAEKFSFPYQLLCDTDRSMGKAYGAHDEAKPNYARRISYVIDPEGKVTATFPGVDPKTHLDEILAAL